MNQNNICNTETKVSYATVPVHLFAGLDYILYAT